MTEDVDSTVDETSAPFEAPSDFESVLSDERALAIGSRAAEEAVPITAAMLRGRVDRFGVAIGTGRRKTAVARVRIRDGKGNISINDRPLEEYFPVERYRHMILAPLRAVGLEGQVDVWARVEGGGLTGQTGALVLGVARAMQARNPQLHHLLSEGGFLTRDGRMVERKKYGFRKARRSFQFSKR
jgi:small subunit ribosomal protein S9